MCEPTTLAIISIASTVAAGGYSYYTQNKAGDYANALGKQQQIVSNRAAADAIRRGAIEESRVRIRNAQVQGQSTAAAAASGIDVGVGAPLDILTSNAAVGELDALTVRSNARREAWGLRNQGAAAANQGALDRLTYRSAGTGDLLGSFGDAAGQAYNFNSQGAFKRRRK